MSFNFAAAGTRAQVVESLDMLTDAQIGNDNFGCQIRDAIVEAISVGTDLEPPADQRYQVQVSGHSSRGSVVTLTAEIKIVPVPPEPPDAPLAE